MPSPRLPGASRNDLRSAQAGASALEGGHGHPRYETTVIAANLSKSIWMAKPFLFSHQGYSDQLTVPQIFVCFMT